MGNLKLLYDKLNKANIQVPDYNTFEQKYGNDKGLEILHSKLINANILVPNIAEFKSKYSNTLESNSIDNQKKVLDNQQTNVTTTVTPKQEEEIAKNKLLDLHKVYISNGLPPDIVDSTEFLMCDKEEGLEQLYNFGKEKFILNEVSYLEFKSWFSDYQKFYKKIPLEYLSNDIWKTAYEEALKKGYSSDFESYKKYIWNNDEEFEVLYNTSSFKESGISKEGFKNLLFPKSKNFLLYNVIDNFQKQEVIYFGFGMLVIVLLLLIIRKIGFNNFKNSFKNIVLNIFSKVKNIINVHIKPKLNESYFQILFILWSFVNIYFFISGVTAYEQENKEAFWILNMDYKNEYDFSELFVYIGFPWLVYFIYLKYFKKKL